MSRPVITFSDVLTKQLVQDWGDVSNVDAEESIALHFEELFSVKRIYVESARNDGETLLLKVATDLWSASREYALSREGSLIW